MSDFLEAFTFGREIEAHGRKWVSLKYFQNRFSLVVKKDDKLPCQVFLVQEEKKKLKIGKENEG